jgi:pyridoxine 5-phosphate synthase
VEYAASKGLVVNAGHGLNLKNIAPIAAIPQIHELNIGHSIIVESVFVGLVQAVKDENSDSGSRISSNVEYQLR